MDLNEIVKFYAYEFTARKDHWCNFCSSFIHKGDKYHKIRVPAHIPFSKATKLIPICMNCAEALIINIDFPAESVCGKESIDYVEEAKRILEEHQNDH